MLSEITIDNLIQPIVSAQEQFEFSVLQKLAIKVKQIGSLSYSAAMALVRASFSGEDITNIQKELAELSRSQLHRIDRVIWEVAESIYAEQQILYAHRGKPYPRLQKNEELCDLILMLIDEIDDEYLGYIADPVFVIRTNSVSRVKAPMTIANAYHSVLSEAAQAVQTGGDFDDKMSNTLDQLLTSGLRKVHIAETGQQRALKLTNLTRTLLLEKSKQLNTRMQAIIAGQLDADGIEISAHMNPAPDHEPVQGRQFLNEEFEKLQSAQSFHDRRNYAYAPIRRPIGAWNCRHWIKTIILGVSVPEYTDRELDAIIARNKHGYTTLSGKHYTMYECTQIQRNYERNIADYAQRCKIAELAKNDALERKYRAKYSTYINAYKAFSRACNLPINGDKFT